MHGTLPEISKCEMNVLYVQPDDLMALAMVMLYDLQDRKFQPREPMRGEGEGAVEEVRLVEDSLFRLMQNCSETSSLSLDFIWGFSL